MLFKISRRNIFRNKRRTFLTVAMMVLGYVLFSFALALSSGAYDNIIAQFIDAKTGEFQVHYQGYLDEPRLYKAISDPEKIRSALENNTQVEGVSFRVEGGALAFHKNKTIGVQVLGMEGDREAELTTFKKRLKIGRLFTSSNAYEVVVGNKIAKILKLNLGDELALISSGADGSMANDLFQVVGIMKGEGATLDDMMVYMPLAAAQEFFSLWGRVSEILVRAKTRDLAKARIDLSFVQEPISISPWQVVEKDFYRAMEADRTGDQIGRFIIILMVALGVFNTILMSTLERTREFGVLKAIGTKPSFLVKMIVMETVFMSLISITVGFVIAYLLNWYFSIWGIKISEPFEYGGFMFAEMKANLNLEVFLLPAIVIAGASAFVSIIPAIQTAFTKPIEELKT